MLPGPATAIDNPLNLKGYLWETGKVYIKEPMPDGDDDDFYAILDGTAEALHSAELTEAISEGKFGQASRLLRGGLISESRIRIAANALIDGIPEENDEAIYKSSEAFRVFLRFLDVLDAEVENASRPSFGSGEGDPRIEILTRVGEAEDAMRALVRNLRKGREGQGK
ncbi:hypothetical protein ACHAXT_011037 [Thalassiosira profunda]